MYNSFVQQYHTTLFTCQGTFFFFHRKRSLDYTFVLLQLLIKYVYTNSRYLSSLSDTQLSQAQRRFIHSFQQVHLPLDLMSLTARAVMLISHVLHIIYVSAFITTDMRQSIF